MKTLKLIFLIVIVLTTTANSFSQRKITSLNGLWEVEESLTSDLPSKYNHKVVVPGLIDMAKPQFDSVGYSSLKRNYYFYRRFFKIAESLTPVAFLKINKAFYGTRVFINRKEVGYNAFCFTPTLFDIHDFLIPGKENEITIQVGAYLNNMPDTIANGTDFEKKKYIAGIYDNVEIIHSGYPFIENIQIVPDIKNQQIRVVGEIVSDKVVKNFKLKYQVGEYKTENKTIGGKSPKMDLVKGKNIIDFIIPIKNCHLWSPEDPFLYRLEVTTGKDSKKERFGMRTFKFDKIKKTAVLNDKPIAMLGTNVCIYRFFEDSLREELPWNEEWVRKLHQTFKTMNSNCIRYCIGFPPEKWYEIADEEGFLIQDEYPIWTFRNSIKSTENALVEEYTRWMRERWNHPCVVIWDAQNETVSDITGNAIRRVRKLDLSNRPWDNGYSTPQSEDDCQESHPYIFSQYSRGTTKPSANGYMKDIFNHKRIPHNLPPDSPKETVKPNNPVIINEYDWLWINRNGTPTKLTKEVYKRLLGDSLTVEQTRSFHAENVGLLTEYWRCHRVAAVIMHFCGLGYSRPDNPPGETSDDLIDVKNLIVEPHFFEMTQHKFAPLCIMINKWENNYKPGEQLDIPVIAINDLQTAWNGPLFISIKKENKTILQLRNDLFIESLGQNIVNFKLNIPLESGNYELVSELEYKGRKISSVRKFQVIK